MQGKVIQFRRGRHTITERHFLIEVSGISTREKAQELVGSKVEWTSPGIKAKVITGKISGAHGNHGMIRAIFEKGLPGQSITTPVVIHSDIKLEEKKEKITKPRKKKEE